MTSCMCTKYGQSKTSQVFGALDYSMHKTTDKCNVGVNFVLCVQSTSFTLIVGTELF